MLSFTVEGNNIRYGLLAVRNVGRNLINAVIAERKARPFSDLADFLSRLHDRELNKRAVESLIKAGAFDRLPQNRRELLENYEEMYAAACENRDRNLTGQMGFFDFGEELSPAVQIKKTENFPPIRLLRLEKEALGFYATGHPLESYSQYLRINGFITAAELMPDREQSVSDGQRVKLLALMTERREHVTKKGDEMCFVMLEDATGTVEGIFFSDAYAKFRSLLNRTEIPLLIDAAVSLGGGDEKPKLIVNHAESAEELQPTDYKTLYVKARRTEKEKIAAIAAAVQDKPGEEQIRLCFSDTREVTRINQAPSINITKELLTKLAKICGKSNIILK